MSTPFQSFIQSTFSLTVSFESVCQCEPSIMDRRRFALRTYAANETRPL